MDRLLQRLALLARAEGLAMRLRVRRAARASAFAAAAFAAGLFAFGFLNFCIFVWIAGVFGSVVAALVLALIDVILAAVCIVLASNRAPSAEEVMVDELRTMALAELGNDAQHLKAQVEHLQQQVTRIGEGISRVTSNDPLQIGLSSIGPIVSLVAR
ncbi:MAG TPA: hypothetical protein VFG38_04945, partial [Pseudomonadales bacterium]|nr:hypothetical protein [Pseudomonadales bacterium]